MEVVELVSGGVAPAIVDLASLNLSAILPYRESCPPRVRHLLVYSEPVDAINTVLDAYTFPSPWDSYLPLSRSYALIAEDLSREETTAVLSSLSKRRQERVLPVIEQLETVQRLESLPYEVSISDHDLDDRSQQSEEDLESSCDEEIEADPDSEHASVCEEVGVGHLDIEF